MSAAAALERGDEVAFVVDGVVAWCGRVADMTGDWVGIRSAIWVQNPIDKSFAGETRVDEVPAALVVPMGQLQPEQRRAALVQQVTRARRAILREWLVELHELGGDRGTVAHRIGQEIEKPSPSLTTLEGDVREALMRLHHPLGPRPSPAPRSAT